MTFSGSENTFVNANSVPEPSSLLMGGIAVGLVGGVCGWRNRKAQVVSLDEGKTRNPPLPGESRVGNLEGGLSVHTSSSRTRSTAVRGLSFQRGGGRPPSWLRQHPEIQCEPSGFQERDAPPSR